MKAILLITSLILLYSKNSAQIVFPNDTAKYEPFSYELRIDSVFQLKKESKFELRFIIHPSSIIPGAKRTLFLMTQNNQRWQARLFQYSNYPQEKYFEIPIDTLNLDALWAKLMKENILKIKNNYLLKDEQGEIARSNMKDGNTYVFCLTSKNAQRSYSFYSPKIAIDEFPKIKEFRQVSKIIDVITTYCNLKALR